MLKQLKVPVFMTIFILAVVGSVFLFNSYEAKFNSSSRNRQLTIFRNTKHFNVSVFGQGLSEVDVVWICRVLERFYLRTNYWFGDKSGKEWLTVYIAGDFPNYYKTNQEMILIPTDWVVNRESRKILIKTAQVITGAYKWPWYKNHIAAGGFAAYLADRYLGRVFKVNNKLDKGKRLSELDKEHYFVWKLKEEQQAYYYGKAGSFIRYLVRRFGMKKIAELYKNDGENWAEVFGEELVTLEDKWWLKY